MKLREVLTVLIIMIAKSLAGSWKFNLSTTKSLFKIKAGNVNVKAPSNTESRTTGYAIKVVTDIDDTVVSSGGLNIFGIHLGGVDNQYKRGTFYPGVIQFGLELSSATAKSAQSIPAKMAVLTARAKEFKFALALKPTGKLCSAFRKRGEENGVEDWGIGDVYYGSVNEWIFQAQKGKRKFLNFEIMMQADQDSGLGVDQYVIVGDTGEKDEEAAERIIAKHPERVKAVFLHSVFDTKPPKSMQFPPRISRSSSRNSSSGRTAAATTTTVMAAAATTTTTTTTTTQQQQQASKKKKTHSPPPFSVVLRPSPPDRTLGGVPIFYFRTYVGAAVKAYRAQILSAAALKRVTAQAVRELEHHTRLSNQKAEAAVTSAIGPAKFLAQIQQKQELALLQSRWEELTNDASEVGFLVPLLPTSIPTAVSVVGQQNSKQLTNV